jgi:hypothetical protein
MTKDFGGVSASPDRDVGAHALRINNSDPATADVSRVKYKPVM